MADKNSIMLGATGRRAEPLQRGVNSVLAHRKFDWRKVTVDGDAGQATFKSAHIALWLLGASDQQLRIVRDGRITQHAYLILTGKEKPSRDMRKRDEARRAEAKKLREAHRESQREDQDGVAPWRGFMVAAWMVGEAKGPDGKKVNWLQLSVDHGWSGGLFSGFRDPLHSEAICLQMCGAPSCPGRCAGRSSEHSGKDGSPPGWGAIDCQDYENFGRIQRQIGSPLRNDLPNDRPHYSTTGH